MVFATCFVSSPSPAKSSRKTKRLPEVGVATSDSTRRNLDGRSGTKDVQDDGEEEVVADAAKTGAFATTELPPNLSGARRPSGLGVLTAPLATLALWAILLLMTRLTASPTELLLG